MRARFVVLLFVAGCGSTPAPASDAAVLDGSPACRSDDDCDDALFCNGAERCIPGATGADALGCVTFVAPCLEGQTCDEPVARCFTDCAVTRDADGDGSDADECGGSDCDDANRERHAGAVEICDPDDVDEDCNADTFGVRDADADGHPDAACCNGERCGTDCDDTSPSVNPLAVDTCDRAMRDEDCSGVPNDRAAGCDCFDGDTQPCDSAGACLAGVQTCVDGAFAACSVSPIAEICDGRDEDCDGAIDETLTVECWPDADGDNVAPVSDSSLVCPDPVRMASPWLGCPANRVGIAPTTPATTDCDDSSGVVRTALVCHVDADADGYGVAAPVTICPAPDGISCPAGHVARGGDCCDSEPRANPGAVAYQGTARAGCGGFDFDCSGAATYELALGLSCGAFTVGEPACTSRNAAFMGAPHFDSNAPPACGTTGAYIIGCSFSTTCGNTTRPELARCR